MSDSPAVPDDLAVLLALALDAMPDLIFIKGARSRLLWVNRATREMYGMSNEELRNAIDPPHVDADDIAQYVRDDHHVFSTGEILNVPVEQVTNTHGVNLPVHTIKAPVRYQGEICGIVGISRFASTTGEQYKDWLSEREDRVDRRQGLSSFVQHVPVAIAMLDRSLHVLACSDAWRALFEWNGRESDYEPYDHHHECRLSLVGPLREAVRTGERMTLERVPMAKGRIASVHIAPWVIGGQRGGHQAAGVLIKVSDDTESVRSAEALERLNDELSQFSYRVSHDLVAPLRTVRGLLELSEFALEDGDTAEIVNLHQRMGAELDSLSAMVRDLMILARADVQTTPERFDLHELVDEVIRSHEGDATECDAIIETHIGVDTMVAERVRLRQALDNLVGNAIKYRRGPAPKITIRASAVGKNLVLIVSDDGLGFDPSVAEVLFEPFKRAHTGHPGTGLGLSIARKHATRLGGNIVARRDDPTTTFTLTVPLMQGQSEPPPG